MFSAIFDNSSSDESDNLEPKPKRKYPNRDYLTRNRIILNKYANLGTEKGKFSTRFRVSKEVFQDLIAKLTDHDCYWKQRFDRKWKECVPCTSKILASLKQLATGCACDQVASEFDIGKSLANQALRKFCRDICKIHEDMFSLTKEKVSYLLKLHQEKHDGLSRLLSFCLGNVPKSSSWFLQGERWTHYCSGRSCL